MAEERARRWYLMSDGSFQVVEDDGRVDMQLQPPTEAPEVARPVLTTTCGSGDTSVPGTSSAPIHQQNPWIPAGTVNVQPNIAYGRAGMSQSRIAGSPLPSSSSSSKSFTPIHGKRRPQTEGASMKRARTASAPLTVQRHPSEGAAPPYVAAHPTIIESSPLTVPSSFPSTSRAATVETMRAYDLRTSGVTSNFQRNMEYYQADHWFSSNDVNDNGSIGVQRPTFTRRGWDAVPSTSRASIAKPSATLENNLRMTTAKNEHTADTELSEHCSRERVPAGTPKLQSNATFGHERTSQWSLASFLPPVSSGYDPIAALEALVRRLEIGEESDSLRNSASGTADGLTDEESIDSPRLVIVTSPENSESGSIDFQAPLSSNVDEAITSTSSGNTEVSLVTDMKIPDVNSNAERNTTNYQDDGKAFHRERTQTAGSETYPHHPMSSSYSCDDAVPSSSHAVLVAAASAGNNASQPRESAETSNQPQRNPVDNIAWVCPFCAEEFNCAADLIKHMDNNMVNGKHLCRLCGELFMGPSDFKSHYIKHTGKKP